MGDDRLAQGCVVLYVKIMNDSDDFLTVAQAAHYVGVSPATLRRWDATGPLKAVRRPGRSYRYYRIADLEPFRLEYGLAGTGKDAVSGFFADADAKIMSNTLLREPQREAYDAAATHFAT